MYYVIVNEKCNGCGGCLESPYFIENSDGFAEVKKGTIVTDSLIAAIKEIIGVCPCGAIELRDDGKGNVTLEDVKKQTIEKLKNVKTVPTVSISDVELKEELFFVNADFDWNYESGVGFNSYESAKRDLKSTVYPMWSRRKEYAYDVLLRYINLDLKKYWSDTDEQSVYKQKTNEIIDILESAEQQLRCIGVKESQLDTLVEVDIKLHEYYTLYLYDGEHAAKKWAEWAENKMDGYGIDSILDKAHIYGFDEYKDTIFGKTKTIRKYGYEGQGNVSDAFRKLVLHQCNIASYKDACESVNRIIDDYNESMEELIRRKIQEIKALP